MQVLTHKKGKLREEKGAGDTKSVQIKDYSCSKKTSNEVFLFLFFCSPTIVEIVINPFVPSLPLPPWMCIVYLLSNKLFSMVHSGSHEIAYNAEGGCCPAAIIRVCIQRMTECNLYKERERERETETDSQVHSGCAGSRPVLHHSQCYSLPLRLLVEGEHCSLPTDSIG